MKLSRREKQALAQVGGRGRRLPAQRTRWQVVEEKFGGRVLVVKNKSGGDLLEVCGFCFTPVAAGVFVDGHCSNCGLPAPAVKKRDDEETQ